MKNERYITNRIDHAFFYYVFIFLEKEYLSREGKKKKKADLFQQNPCQKSHPDGGWATAGAADQGCFCVICISLK